MTVTLKNCVTILNCVIIVLVQSLSVAPTGHKPHCYCCIKSTSWWPAQPQMFPILVVITVIRVIGLPIKLLDCHQHQKDSKTDAQPRKHFPLVRRPVNVWGVPPSFKPSPRISGALGHLARWHLFSRDNNSNRSAPTLLIMTSELPLYPREIQNLRGAAMATVKLTYLNFKGRAELLRYILAQASVEYEDIRIEPEKWAEAMAGKLLFKLWPWSPASYSAGTEFGIPVLEFEGTVLKSNEVIAKFLAEKYSKWIGSVTPQALCTLLKNRLQRINSRWNTSSCWHCCYHWNNLEQDVENVLGERWSKKGEHEPSKPSNFNTESYRQNTWKNWWRITCQQRWRNWKGKQLWITQRRGG